MKDIILIISLLIGIPFFLAGLLLSAIVTWGVTGFAMSNHYLNKIIDEKCKT